MLLQRIELCIKERRMPPTRFGRDAVADPRLVFDLRAGRRLRPVTECRICAYLDRLERQGAVGATS